MRKRAFLIFVVIVTSLVAALVGFMQSAQFASVFKKALAKYMPADLGIQGDFSAFSIRLFPPSISIKNPSVVFKERNAVDLPGGTSIKAERVDLEFRPFQMFSGNILVHRVLIVDGDIRLDFSESYLSKKPKKSSSLSFSWDELLKIHAEGVALENTKVQLTLANPSLSASFLAKSLSLEQWSGRSGIGYELSVDFQGLQGTFPKELQFFELVTNAKVKTKVNAAGLSFEDLSLTTAELNVEGSGTIKGNILKQKELLFDSELIVKGELSNALKAALKTKEKLNLPSGTVTFQGKVKGDLAHAIESIKAEGSLAISDFNYKAWQIDNSRLDLTWQSSSDGGEISITSGLFESDEKPRKGGNQPGWGGKIEVDPCRFRVAQIISRQLEKPLVIPIKFQRAHIHWLAATGIKDIYPLDFRVSGPANISFGFIEKDFWNLEADADLKLDAFQLDNQRLGQVKPLKKVLEIPQIALSGKLSVDPNGIRPNDMKLSLPNSNFVLNGKVDFQTGYDLFAKGTANLADVGQIAENDIKGEGTLAVHVHGPSSRVFVDFDADVENGYYLKLQLGDLKGRVTWDDDPQHLIFTQAQVTQGHTKYLANGRFEVGDAQKAALDVSVEKGTVQDFFKIFEELTKDLWWLPRSLDGETSGTIKIFGGLDLAKLQVLADMKGTGWDYLSEKFKSVNLVGGYDKGKYYLQSFRTLKHLGGFFGHISFDADKRFDWELKSENLSVMDLDHVAHLDVPFRGKLVVTSFGNGKVGSLESVTKASLTDFVVRGANYPSSEATLRTTGGATTFQGLALGGQGKVSLSYDFKPNSRNQIDAIFNNFDFSPLLLILNSRMMHDKQLSGLFSGTINLNFETGKLEYGSGKVEISNYFLSKTGASFKLSNPVVFNSDKGSFNIEDLSISDYKSNKRVATLSLNAKSAQLNGTVSGDLDLSVAEFLTSTINQASGKAKLDFSIRGNIKEPVVNGKSTVEKGFLRIASLESPFENINGSLLLRQNVISVHNLEGDLANGRVHSRGSIELFADRYPKLDLSSYIVGSRLKIFPFQYIKVGGKINVHGDQIPYDVDGDIIAASAFSKEKVLNKTQGQLLKSANYTPLATSIDQSDYPKFKLNINVKADKGIIVQNDLFDAELKANVTLVNTIQTPRLLGNAELLHGQLTFKDRIFQIQSAKLNFDNPAVINPEFDLTANTDLNGTKVLVYASGRLDKYKIELSSNPVLPEAEILSLLALGLTSDEVRRLKARDRGAFEQGEAASLLLHSLDFNRDVQDKTGFQVDIDEAVNTQAGSSIFRKSSDSDAAAAPKIVIKRQLGKKVDVSVGSTVGVGTNKQQEVNAEIHVTPGFSIIGVWDKQEGVESTSTNSSSYGSYGVDLKLQKRFK